MKKIRTYLDIAKENCEVAEKIVQSFDDENMLNYAAYHLQQAVELSMKYALLLNGIDFPKVHSINQLISYFLNYGLNEYVNEYIDEHSDMLTNWESCTRYIVNYFVEKRKIDKAIPEIKKYISDIESMTKCIVISDQDDEIDYIDDIHKKSR